MTNGKSHRRGEERQAQGHLGVQYSPAEFLE